MNPNVTDYAALNHGTYLYWAHRKGWTAENNSHAGLRGWYEDRGDPTRDYTESKFSKVMARDIDKIDGIIEKIKKQLGDCPVYISFDIDVVDSASAPATGSIIAGGWSSREILSIIDGLAGINLVGADIAQVSPWGDLTNGVASDNAGEAGRAILGLMVIKPVICAYTTVDISFICWHLVLAPLEVLQEAEDLEKQIEKCLPPKFTNEILESRTLDHHLQFFELLRDAARLYLRQCVHMEFSHSPKSTIIVVRSLKNISSLFGTTVDRGLLFSLLIFGVDMIGQDSRDWVLNLMVSFYKWRLARTIEAAIALMKKIWSANSD
ncbi:hypothetical protein KL906_003889 [Ogataea polymorpha]|nr:hypothetical protein KL906_003889 [Ogataea polymorpha]